MKIEQIKIGELAAFVESPLYKRFHEIPITRLRAFSQARNPRASADDVALLVAHDGDKLLSFIGLLPDRVVLGEQVQKVWWNSCWWANENEKDNGSMQLFYLACKLTNGKLYFPELTPHTIDLLKKMRMFSTQELPGVRGYLQLQLSVLLVRRNKVFSNIHFLLLLLDFFVNALFFCVRWSWKRKLEKKKLNYKIIPRIDDEAATFIAHHHANELFRRNETELNWALDYPWISTENLQLEKKYPFSHHAKSFKVLVVKVYENDQMTGFLEVLLRDGNAKLSYSYFQPHSVSTVVAVLYKLLLDNNVISFVTFNDSLLHFIQGAKNPFLLIRKQSKTIAFPRDVEIFSQSIQDGDGDCVFV